MVLTQTVGPAWGKVTTRNFSGEILLGAPDILCGVSLSNHGQLAAFAVPCNILVDPHYLLKQDIFHLRACAFRASSLWMPWIALVTQKGPSCLSSGCWILTLFFFNLAFVEALIIERGVGKRIEYFKPISLLFTAFCVLITVARCGFCFVLKLKLFSANSVQYNLMYSVQAKFSFWKFSCLFFFSPLPFTSRSLPNLLQWLMGQWVPVCTITQGLCLNSSWKHLYRKWRKLISKLCLPWMTSGRWSKTNFFSLSVVAIFLSSHGP